MFLTHFNLYLWIYKETLTGIFICPFSKLIRREQRRGREVSCSLAIFAGYWTCRWKSSNAEESGRGEVLGRALYPPDVAMWMMELGHSWACSSLRVWLQCNQECDCSTYWHLSDSLDLDSNTLSCATSLYLLKTGAPVKSQHCSPIFTAVWLNT